MTHQDDGQLLERFDRRLADIEAEIPSPPPWRGPAVRADGPGLGFGSLVSVTKFVIAGAIVALFGGFLLAGLLTQPREDDTAPAAVTASPSPMTTEELLSGMVTEEIEPGVYRVLEDGIRDLRTNVWGVAVSGTADVWIDRHAQDVSYVARLGHDQEFELAAVEDGVIGTGLNVDRDGSIRAFLRGLDSGDELTFDGQAWIAAERRLGVGGPGIGDAVSGDGFWADSTCCAPELWVTTSDAGDRAPQRLDLRSAEYPFRSDEGESFGSGPVGGGGVMVAPSGDGTIWVSVGIPGHVRFRLASFDGMTFEPVLGIADPSGPASGSGGPEDSGQNRLTAMAEAPDGTLWLSIWNRFENDLRSWSWDGLSWTQHDPIETKAGNAWTETWSVARDGARTGIRFLPDGSMWFDGLVHFDGQRSTPFSSPTTETVPTSKVASTSVAPDGALWLVMVDGYGEEGGCEISPACATRTVGLYVITPRAAMATE